MYRAVAGDHFLVAITEENLQKILKGDNLYVQNEDIGVPFDIQIALENTTGIGIEGRKCLTNAFTKESLLDLRKGAYRKIPKGEHVPMNVLIFYGRSIIEVQKIVNEALGIQKEPIDVKPTEFYMEKTENGKTTTKRGHAMPSIFRGGTPPNVF